MKFCKHNDHDVTISWVKMEAFPLKTKEEDLERGAPGNGAAVTHSSDRLFKYSIGYITNNSICIGDKY